MTVLEIEDARLSELQAPPPLPYSSNAWVKLADFLTRNWETGILSGSPRAEAIFEFLPRGCDIEAKYANFRLIQKGGKYGKMP